jgi:Putative SAM-dependent methyltransferase
MIEDIAQKDQISRKPALQKCEAYMNTLSKEYYSGKAPALAYEDPSCRWAYVYTHVVANADLLVYALDRYASKNERFEQKLLEEELNICVVGGGPGSELLAFAKYYVELEPENQISLSFSQIDRVVEWSENIQILKNSLKSKLKKDFGRPVEWPVTMDSNFVTLDVTQNSSFAKLAHIFKCDIAVMGYVISEVFDFKAFLPLLEAIKQGSKKNSYLIITDRSDDQTKEKIEKTIKTLGGVIIDKFAKKQNLDGSEQLAVLKEAFPDISRKPRVTWDSVSYLVQLK